MTDENSGFATGNVNVSLQVLPRAEGVEIYDLVERAIGVESRRARVCSR